MAEGTGVCTSISGETMGNGAITSPAGGFFMQPLHVSDTNTHSIMSRTGKVQRFMVYSVPSFPGAYHRQ
jgi:hypothetical protein